MREISCDVLICGGGVGGCAAAMAACSLGLNVVMSEENDWIGGQLTSQAVPPDEHPWIEEFGCTVRYREFRNRVRSFYRDHYPLNAEARAKKDLNPGGGWVSWLCHEPRVAWLVLQEMLAPFLESGKLTILKAVPGETDVVDDRVRSVQLWMEEAEQNISVEAKYFLDATELGDMLMLTGTELITGAESQKDTGEAHAVEGPPQPDCIQAITHVMAIAWDPEGGHVINKPETYDQWKTYKPSFWPGPLLGWQVIGAHDGLVKKLPLINPENREYELLSYRQCIDPTIYDSSWVGHLATLVNWPQNDYFVHALNDDENDETYMRPYLEAEDLSLSLLYWMQTEAPRHDGGVGYPELYLRPDITGTDSGLAQHPYIRESRRIKAEFTILEQHVSEHDNPGRDRAIEFYDSVGIGAYRIDLHPSTSGANTIDFGSLPFQIPLGALIPQRMRNLLPACKNIGTTHITNGCYRLHPVEWNIGEAAGALAAFCIKRNLEPHQVHASAQFTEDFQKLLVDQGVEIAWPNTQLHAL